MLRDRAILTLPAGDIGSSNDPVQGRFVLAGDLEISMNFRTGYVIGGRGAAINSVIQQYAGDGEAENGQGFFVDLGSGAHVIEINFRGWKGAEVPASYDSNDKPDSWEPAQWGNTGDASSKTYADTTGAHPLSQINCLEQYLRHLKIDSASPASLQYGEFSPSGLYEDSLDVVLEGPQFTRTSDQPTPTFDGTLTMIEAAAIQDVYSAVQRGAE